VLGIFTPVWSNLYTRALGSFSEGCMLDPAESLDDSPSLGRRLVILIRFVDASDHRPQESEVAVWDLGEAYIEGPRLRAANKK
jgi:hypothetical protein